MNAIKRKVSVLSRTGRCNESTESTIIQQTQTIHNRLRTSFNRVRPLIDGKRHTQCKQIPINANACETMPENAYTEVVVLIGKKEHARSQPTSRGDKGGANSPPPKNHFLFPLPHESWSIMVGRTRAVGNKLANNCITRLIGTISQQTHRVFG